MRIADYITGALDDIWAAKLRTFLTSLGIIIGVGSVVLLMAIGAGVEATVTGTFTDLGSTRVMVQPSAPRTADSSGPGDGPGGGMSGAVASTLTIADAAALEAVEGVAAVAPVIQVPVVVSGPADQLQLAATGTTPAYAEVTQQELVAGRSFVEGASEVVLNEAATERLFGDGASVGETITLRDQTFEVVGVFRDETQAFGPPAAEQSVAPAVFIPVETALDLAGVETVAQLVLTAESPDVVEATVERVRVTLVELHGGVEDFTLLSFQELMASFTQIFGVLTTFLAAIAGISLLVGGIGIMNIMLASVTERTREVGIAKAIGATRRNVVMQFLVEATTLSMLGGVLGLVVAWLGTVAIDQLLGLPAVVTVNTVLLAVGVSAAIGVFFGVMPAWRAARLDPIVALRHE